VWEATTPGDPGRNWAINLSMTEGYDDNVYTTEKKPQSSFTSTLEPQLTVNLPMERSSFGMRYTYQASWLTSLPNTPLRQANIGDFTFSYMFTPRLSLSITDNLRSGVNPEEVTDQDGVPVVRQQRGDYIYNNISASLSYSLSRRWIASLSGSWNFWDYKQDIFSIPYNRNNFSLNLNAQYSIDQRTFTGVAYQFSAVRYENNNLAKANWTDNTWPNISDPGIPASANIRDGNLNTLYGFINRRFNPQWSGQLNAGFQWTVFGGGDYASRDNSPYFSASTSYNYAPSSFISAIAGYSQSISEVAQYRSSDRASLTLRLDHQLTIRLRLSLYGTFALSSYQNPLPGYPLSNEFSTSQLIAFNFTYAFTRWMQLIGSYSFDTVNDDVSGSFTRNRLNLGLRFRY
jgi:hypothetical protein